MRLKLMTLRSKPDLRLRVRGLTDCAILAPFMVSFLPLYASYLTNKLFSRGRIWVETHLYRKTYL